VSVSSRLPRRPETTHLVYFENTVLDSSHLGESSVLAIGPRHTYQSLTDVEGKWLNDLPSQRQYPQFWCDVKKMEAYAANWCPLCQRRLRNGFCTPGYRGVHIRQWVYWEHLPVAVTSSKSPVKKTERRS
jgi:hypothetical protein